MGRCWLVWRLPIPTDRPTRSGFLIWGPRSGFDMQQLRTWLPAAVAVCALAIRCPRRRHPSRSRRRRCHRCRNGPGYHRRCRAAHARPWPNVLAATCRFGAFSEIWPSEAISALCEGPWRPSMRACVFRIPKVYTGMCVVCVWVRFFITSAPPGYT